MEPEHPNLVILHAHDLGRFLGCYGVDTVDTPHLDRLAGQSIRFTQAQCTSPGCSPARAALFTGHYPHTTGVLGLTHGNFGWRMNDRVTHLARRLADAGYHTALCGTYHEDNPTDADRIRDHHGFQERVGGGQRAHEVAASVSDWLVEGRPTDKPFYLQAGVFEPHRVGATDPEDARRFMPFVDQHIPDPDPEEPVTIPGYLEDTPGTRREMRELQAAVRHMDQQFGRILDALNEQGLMDNTLILFTTDHGLALPRAKSTCYQAGLEVALMLKLPAGDGVKPSVNDQPVSHIDIVPTILERLGLPGAEHLPGQSLLSPIRNPEAGHHPFLFAEKTYHDNYDPKRSVRDARYKLIANFAYSHSFTDCSQSWQPRAQPVVPANPAGSYTPDFELYDLETDPCELVDLAEDPAYQEIQDTLIAALGRWMRETEDPLLDGPVPQAQFHRVMKRLGSCG
ncbi:MAG: sulfatase family protein [Opitutales bacterium]